MKIQVLCISLLMFVWTTVIQAQWESMIGPYGGNIRDLDENDQYQYAATTDGLYRSTDAANWTKLTLVPGKNLDCTSISVLDSVIVATAYERIGGNTARQFFRSDSNGDNWSSITSPSARPVSKLYLTSFGIYVYDFVDLWFSSDKGENWSLSNYPELHNQIFSLQVVDGDIWLSTLGSLWKADVADTQWTAIAIPDQSAQIHQLFVHDSVILALAPYQETLFRSTNYGETWTVHQNEIWGLVVYVNFAKLGTTYFAALDHLILRSDDLGAIWTPTPSRYYSTATEMISHENSLLFATIYQGVMRSDDLGQSTYSSSHGITAANVTHLIATDSSVIASCNRHGLFNLAETGHDWAYEFDDTLFNQFVVDIVRHDTSMFATSFDGGIYRYSQAGQSWLNVTGDSHPTYSNYYFLEDALFVLANHGLEQWHPETESWTDFVFIAEGHTVHPRKITSNTQYAFAADNDAIYRKEISGSTWSKVLVPDTIPTVEYHSIAGLHIVGNKVFLLMVLTLDSKEYRVLVSPDNGISWEFAETDFPDIIFPWWSGLGPIHNVSDVAVTHGDDYTLGVVITGTDNIHWEDFNEGLPTLHINDIAFDDVYIYAGTSTHGVWRRPLSDLIQTGTSSPGIVRPFTVYPNPSSGDFSFNIDLPAEEMATISFTDYNGKLLASTAQLIQPGLNHIKLPVNQPGAGILTIQTATSLAVAKVVVR
jgi:photosystem II stability/assembly factor-like uncharacterized protein